MKRFVRVALPIAALLLLAMAGLVANTRHTHAALTFNSAAEILVDV